MEEIKILEFISSGSGYGDGDGSGYGDGDGSGYGSGDGSGNGKGKGYGYGDGLKSIRGKKIYMVDGIATTIRSNADALVPSEFFVRKYIGPAVRIAPEKHIICLFVRFKATFVLMPDKSFGTATDIAIRFSSLSVNSRWILQGFLS